MNLVKRKTKTTLQLVTIIETCTQGLQSDHVLRFVSVPFVFVMKLFPRSEVTFIIQTKASHVYASHRSIGF